MENFNNDPFACIDHVGFAVKDMDEAIKYHCDVLGFHVLLREKNEGHGVEEAMIATGEFGKETTVVQLLAPLGEGVAGIGAPLFAAILICFIGAVVSAFASTTGILGALIGTPWLPDFSGAILFIGALWLGAQTLTDISLSIFVGTIVAAYSTLFVAAPLYSLLRENEPALKTRDSRVLAARERALADA